MSARSQASQRILNFLSDKDLCQVNDGYNCYGPDKKYRFIAFDIRAQLDGQVKVYGPTFIHVSTQGPVSDVNGDQVFESVDDCIAYLQAMWVDRDQEAAAKVPRKPAKGKPK